MTNLLKAEVNRWFSRRLWWAMLLGAVALAALVLVGMAAGYSPQTPAQIAQAERDYADAVKQAEQDRQDCLDDGQPAEDCEAWVPERADFVQVPPTYPMLVEIGAQTATLISELAALLVAASFMGAEFKSGSLATWLTYVPRRVPVFVSKALVAGGGSALLGVIVQAIVQAGVLLLGWLWLGPGGLHGAGAEWTVVGRGIVATIAAGLIGLCLATLFGSTIAPVAALLGAVVVQWVAGLITLLIGAAPWMIRLLPDNNLNAFVSGHFETSYYEIGPSGAEIERQVEIGLGQASLYLGCLLVAAVASALWSFTRREVR